MLNPKVDNYLEIGCGRCSLVGTPACKVHKWQPELAYLRGILLDCGLFEDLKWSMPCYTFQDNNILILAAFKDFCSLNFFKGALIKDEHGILVKAGENTQAARLAKFTNVEDIIKVELILKAYIYEAIEIEKSGVKIESKKATELVFPEEFLQIIAENPALKTAFYALTPGRQRGYHIHFSQPKQSKTRTSRVENCIAQIMAGKGFNE